MDYGKQVLCFLDLETLGHDPLKLIETREGARYLIPWHEIIDIGCIFARSENLEILGEFQTLVKPEHPERCIPNIINHYPERAKAGEWNNALSLWIAIREFFNDCRIYSGGPAVCPGGQNWFFDWSFLITAFAWLEISSDEQNKYLSYKRFDTASMAIQELKESGAPLDLSLFSLRSGKLQAALGIEPEPVPHRAINGAWQAWLVFRKLEEIKSARLTPR